MLTPEEPLWAYLGNSPEMQILRPHVRHWENSLSSLGNLHLRYSRHFGWKSTFENHCFHMSRHRFWFTLRTLNFHRLAQVPWNRKFSNKQTKPGLMADWLGWCNRCKPFQNMENWALKCYDVGIGNQYCWTTEKYGVFLLFPFLLNSFLASWKCSFEAGLKI